VTVSAGDGERRELFALLFVFVVVPSRPMGSTGTVAAGFGEFMRCTPWLGPAAAPRRSLGRARCPIDGECGAVFRAVVATGRVAEEATPTEEAGRPLLSLSIARWPRDGEFGGAAVLLLQGISPPPPW